MTVIQSLAPGQKSFLNLLSEIHGTQPNARDMYAIGPDGRQRVLVPVGKDRYDLYISVNVGELSGRETDRDLQDLAYMEDKTAIERGGSWTIENVTYIFTVDRFTCRFMPARSRWAGANTRLRYWFFAARMGEDQIVARVRRLVATIMRARGIKIVETCLKKGFTPYGPVLSVVEMFADAADLLEKYSRQVFVSCRSKPAAPAASGPDIPNQARDLAGQVLQVLKDRLPKLYETFRTLISVEYPELCTLPGPP